MNVFSMDGLFYKFGALMFDLMIINLLFIALTAVGLGFTFGLAFTASLYAIYEGVRKQKGRLLHHFIRSVKDNFRQGLLLSIILSVLSIFSTWTVGNASVLGRLSSIALIPQYLLIFEISIITLYLFPLITKIKIGTKEALKHAFYMAHRHFLTSVSCISLVVLSYYATTRVSSVFIAVAFGGISYIVERMILENIIIERYVSEDLKRELRVVEYDYE